MASLTDSVTLAGRTAGSRVVFGPHETNLGRKRSFSPRHTAYYERRAAGGAGIVVTEVASVHVSDWPYERAPLAADAAEGWREIAAACHGHGALVLAGLGHTGLQGSSAFSQAVLWAPSPFPDAGSREMPMAMTQREIDAVVSGFADAARRATLSDLDGVEIDAGPGALLRQFHSGLSNMRDDVYGEDRLRLTRDVLVAVRDVIGDRSILALRLSCDELAPWAGVTPEMAAEQAAELAPLVDLLTVVRGGPYAASAYRPDAHAEPMFNVELTRTIKDAVDIPIVLQGSVIDPAAAQSAVDAGVADLVEMTRAQIADAELVAKVRTGVPERIRPCILCNQTCRVRDNRNPIITCVGDPRSGHETEDPVLSGTDAAPRGVLVVGGGPAGMETARVLAMRGHDVRLVEQDDRLGGALRTAAVGPGRERLAALADWLEAECRRLGVRIETGTRIDDVSGDAVLCTGSRPRGDNDALGVLAAGVDALPDGPIVVHDTIGGPIAVALAEWLAGAGRDVAFVTGDTVAGTMLSLTGDLADANGRLQRAGVTRHLRSLLREVTAGTAVVEDVWTGERREIPCAVKVDCGHRLPEEELYLRHPDTPRAGDCVAPRSVHEAILEGRRAALALATARQAVKA